MSFYFEIFFIFLYVYTYIFKAQILIFIMRNTQNEFELYWTFLILYIIKCVWISIMIFFLFSYVLIISYFLFMVI